MSDYPTIGDCDVCVLGYDGDSPEFCHTKIRSARRTHICCECGDSINVGDQYECVSGRWDGGISRYKTCSPCVEIRMKFSCDGSWIFGSTWETLREELFDRLTTGCLTGLSPAAKEKILGAWRKWKGLPESRP